MTASTNGNGNDPAADHLTYGILGDDAASPLEKLEKYTGEVDWNYLRPHFKAGALVYVDSSLSLTEVGHAFSIDDAERVKEWRKSGDLVTPSEPHAVYWEESGASFRALVVSPFVLIQPIEVA
jgi:hypothetical protein